MPSVNPQIVSRQPQSCPVELLAKYFALHGPRPGALFITVGLQSLELIFQTSCPLLYVFVGSPLQFTRDSFRIGATSHAADKGLSDTQIRLSKVS